MDEAQASPGLREAREPIQAKEAENRPLGDSTAESQGLDRNTVTTLTQEKEILEKKGIKRKWAQIPSKKEQRRERSNKAARVRVANIDDYLELYNQSVADALSKSDSVPQKLVYTPMQYGLTRWKSSEKDRFFAALDKYGRLDVRSIARAVGTKSEPEVQAFIQVLAQALYDRHFNQERALKRFPVQFAELPAASELSAECTEALEDCADALAEKQYAWEVRQEKLLVEDLWLLDSEAAKRLKQLKGAKSVKQEQEVEHGQQLEHTHEPEPRLKLEHIDESKPRQELEQQPASQLSQETSRIYARNERISMTRINRTTAELEAAFDLLNLKRFISLSTNFYMNSGDKDWHWLTHAKPGESPALFATAFIDFHNLVVGILRRLVSSLISIAKSRIESDPRPSSKDIVHAADVEAACDVLGFNYDKTKYWRDITGRFNFKVYDQPTGRSGKKVRLSLSEVERRLGEAFSRKINEGLEISQPAASDLEDDEESDDSTSSIDVPAELSVDESRMRSQEKNLASHDIYAEVQDTKRAWKEELELWKMMKKKPQSKEPFILNSDPSMPRTIKPMKEDYVDWQDKIDYKSEWEVYEKPLEERALRKNRRLKRRHRRASSSSASSSDEMPLVDEKQQLADQEEDSSEEDDERDPEIEDTHDNLDNRPELTDTESDSDDLDNDHDLPQMRSPAEEGDLVPGKIASDVDMEDSEEFLSSVEGSSSAEDSEGYASSLHTDDIATDEDAAESSSSSGSASGSTSSSVDAADSNPDDDQMLSAAEPEQEHVEIQEDTHMQVDAQSQ
ncbi:hypothetical protein MMC10_010019 [Thelotrema lepadinum]|nr:hypothetical protein [Thelotrema lepadinum]